MDKIPKIYTADEVADLLRISRRTVNNYVKGGQIKPLHMGKYLRFTEEAVLEFLSQGVERGYFDRVAPKRTVPPVPEAAPAAVEPPSPPKLEGDSLQARIGELEARAGECRESDPVLSEALSREIEALTALLPWTEELDRAEAEGPLGEIQRIKRILRDMLIRQYETAESLEGRLGELALALHGERPQDLRPKPRQRRIRK